jgi:general secretion pathway protein E
MRALIHKAYGIILVTGPTGAGKTTTLYGALSEINSTTKKIITVEDPIEYQLHGVNQVQINPKIELSFATGLRSILRQDPDVIMVGEIRDTETAEIAIQASLTGHLVFSTLHTNDSAGALTRLMDMGIEPFLVASSLLGVVAQRLVRLLCKTCAEKYQPTDAELNQLGVTRAQIKNASFSRPVGCPNCVETGYSGRVGIYEILLLSEKTRGLLMASADAGSIKKAAVAQGMESLRIAGARKVLQNLTSVAEVLRVSQEESMFDE